MKSRSRARKFDRKLAGYCAAAAGASLVLAGSATAGVVYTDIADQVLSPGESYTIDFNGDSTNDLRIPSSGWSSSFAQFEAASFSAQVLGTSSGNDNALALASGYVVGSGVSATWMGAPDLWSVGSYYSSSSSSFSSYSYANWAGADHKYAGVKFLIGGDTHYGWVEMSAAASRDSITIYSYAYESVADAPITTGAVPEPASLALFALGAAGLVAWRSRRRKKA